MNDPILEEIKARLAADKGQWPAIAAKTKVPYFTIANIFSGKSPNPTLNTLRPLIDYFGIVVGPRTDEQVAAQ